MEKIRYLIRKRAPDGRTLHYWQPGKHVRALGFELVALGDDAATAIEAARRLNAKVDAARTMRAESAPDAEPGRTVKALIARYRTSDEFMRLRPGTRRVYLQSLGVIERWAGDLQVTVITPKRVKEFYKPFHARTPAYANSFLRVLRVLLQFGVSEDWLASNPMSKRDGQGVRLIGTAPRRVIWPLDAVEAFVALADALGRPSLGDAVLIGLWLAQR